MLKMRVILWVLGWLLRRASKRNTDLQTYLDSKSLAFQIQTRSGVGRQFHVKDQRVDSFGGLAESPAFKVIFNDPQTANRIMLSKDKQAFLRGIQDKEVEIEGNLQDVLWFQGMLKYLRPRKPNSKTQ